METWKKIAIAAAVVLVIYFAVKYFNSKKIADEKQVAATPSTTSKNTGVVIPTGESRINPSDFSSPTDAQ